MKVAVVGHVEWIEFARVERVPAPGEIVHALESWQEPGGGGAVAAVQLARLARDCFFLTALGDDELGHRAERELTALGVRVEAVWRPTPQRRAFVFTDAHAERTITVMGDRVGPHGADPLPWPELADVDGVYFTAGDAGAVRAARAARMLVSTARTIRPLAEAGAQIDMLVASSRDVGERYTHGDIEPPPHLVAAHGRRWRRMGRGARRHEDRLDRRPASRAAGRRLRRGRLVRRRSHVRAGGRPLTRGSPRDRRAVWRGVRHGPGPVRRSAPRQRLTAA